MRVAMKKHKFKVVVLADGRVVVDGVPVVKGQTVEVTIRIDGETVPTYPLLGLPVHYEEPFHSAADDSEWDASR